MIMANLGSNRDPGIAHEIAATLGLVAQQKEPAIYLGMDPKGDYLNKAHLLGSPARSIPTGGGNYLSAEREINSLPLAYLSSSLQSFPYTREQKIDYKQG